MRRPSPAAVAAFALHGGTPRARSDLLLSQSRCEGVRARSLMLCIANYELRVLPK